MVGPGGQKKLPLTLVVRNVSSYLHVLVSNLGRHLSSFEDRATSPPKSSFLTKGLSYDLTSPEVYSLTIGIRSKPSKLGKKIAISCRP